jgi:hypothetical protein
VSISGSSYWPRSAVYVQGIAPFSRIHATATEVSRPPEKAMPTRSPTGREVRTLDMSAILYRPLHIHELGVEVESMGIAVRPGGQTAIHLLSTGECSGGAQLSPPSLPEAPAVTSFRR